MDQLLKAGVGRADITPELGVQLMGYPIEFRHATSVHDNLSATVLLLEYSCTKSAIVNLTIGAIDENEANTIKNIIGNKLNIDPSNIIVSIIQTHSAPNTFDLWGWSDKNEDYCNGVVRPAILKAALEAEQKKKPCRVGIGTVNSKVGINRREILEDGRVILGQNPWGPYDPTMTVISFVSNNSPVANIIHYGAHPTSAGGNTEITRDWPGIMTDKLESITGGVTFFMNGAVGDVGPRLSNGKTTGEDISYVHEIGNRAGFDAIKAFNTIKEYRELDLEVISEKIFMPYRPSPSFETAKQKLITSEKSKDKAGLAKAEYLFWKHLVGEYEKGDIKTGRFFDQTIIRIGPITIVPFPGEPFSEIVLRIREYSPYQYTLCISTCNGGMGYFATRDSLHRGGYEVEVAKAFSPYLMVENIDDILVQENLKLLRNMKCFSTRG